MHARRDRHLPGAQGGPGAEQEPANFFTYKQWIPDGTVTAKNGLDEIPHPEFGIAALAFGTVLHRRCSRWSWPCRSPSASRCSSPTTRRAGWLRSSATSSTCWPPCPSVVYGLWGLFFLVPHLIPLSQWLTTYFGWIPIFGTEGGFGKSIFAAGTRAGDHDPADHRGDLPRGLPAGPADPRRGRAGAGRDPLGDDPHCGAARSASPASLSAAMLGLGRALGETIAVALVLSSNFEIVCKIFTPGGNTIAANIANQFGDAGKIGLGALIASGLVLFVITLLVNIGARLIIRRAPSPAGAVRMTTPHPRARRPPGGAAQHAASSPGRVLVGHSDRRALARARCCSSPSPRSRAAPTSWSFFVLALPGRADRRVELVVEGRRRAIDRFVTDAGRRCVRRSRWCRWWRSSATRSRRRRSSASTGRSSPTRCAGSPSPIRAAAPTTRSSAPSSRSRIATCIARPARPAGRDLPGRVRARAASAG